MSNDTNELVALRHIVGQYNADLLNAVYAKHIALAELTAAKAQLEAADKELTKLRLDLLTAQGQAIQPPEPSER
jgi:hypothetical protein